MLATTRADIDAAAVTKADIWAARAAAFPNGVELKPVVVRTVVVRI